LTYLLIYFCFSLFQNIYTGTGAYPLFFSGLQQLKHKVEYSSHSSAKIKNEWSYTSTPLYAFMVWTGTTLPFYLYLTYLFIL